MKIKISKNQWTNIGKTAGWSNFSAIEFLTTLELQKRSVLQEILNAHPDIVEELMSRPEMKLEYLKMTGRDYNP